MRPAVAATPAGQFDLDPMSPTAVDQTYQDLVDDTRQLAKAVDTSVQGTLQGQASVSCSAAGCLVGATVRLDFTTGANTRVTGGTATAEMNATVSVDGLPAGGCTDTSTFAALGTGVFSCDAASAGPVFAEALEQARLLAEARAAPGSIYYYRVPYSARAEILVEAQVDVERQVQQLEQERDAANRANCFTPNSFAAGTAVVGPDGAAEPIEQVAAGTTVLTGLPGRPRTTLGRVSARITRYGRERVVRLTLAADTGPDPGAHSRTTLGTVVATAGHRFAVGDSWVDASDLRPGTTLDSTSGRTVRVVSVEGADRTAIFYNLTVDGTHAFYVGVGDAAVLVHNAGPLPSPCPSASSGASTSTATPTTASTTAAADEAEQLRKLSYDPDKGGVTSGSQLEARDALKLVRDGRIPGPIRRADGKVSPRENGADFVDGNNKLWDHKLAISSRTWDPRKFLDKIALNDLRNGEDIIVNHEKLSSDDFAGLRAEIDRRNLRDRFQFVP